MSFKVGDRVYFKLIEDGTKLKNGEKYTAPDIYPEDPKTVLTIKDIDYHGRIYPIYCLWEAKNKYPEEGGDEMVEFREWFLPEELVIINKRLDINFDEE